MKKLFIFFYFINFTTVNASSSNYEWQQILETDNGGLIFIDKNSIFTEGNNTFFIKLHEYSDFNEYGEKSSIILHKVDCNNLKFKYLSDLYFKLSMGEGEPSFVGNKESEWIEVKKNTISSYLIEYVCDY